MERCNGGPYLPRLSFRDYALGFVLLFCFFFVIASRDEYIVLLNLSSNQYRNTRE